MACDNNLSFFCNFMTLLLFCHDFVFDVASVNFWG